MKASIVGDAPCPSCRSIGRDKTGNHLILFSDGGKYCNRCGYTETNRETVEESKLTLDEISKLPTHDYRGIDSEILKAAGVKTEMSPTARGEVVAVYYPVYNTDRELIGYKKRGLPKSFSTVGTTRGARKQFFGQEQIGEGGKLLIIVEGEDDTLAARQILKDLNKPYSVVGISFGADSAEALARDNVNWLLSFDTVCIIPDNDAAGSKAAEAIASLLPSGKVKIGHHSEKDICDLIKANKDDEFLQAVWKAKKHVPKGITSAKDLKSVVMAGKSRNSVPLAPVFKNVNTALDGIGLGEVCVVTGGTGGGKSQWCDENIAYWLSQGIRVGVLKMEHNDSTNVMNILSTYIGANLRKESIRSQIPKEELDRAYDSMVQGEKDDDLLWIINNAFDDESDEGFLDKFRSLAITLQCKVIVVDHLHAILYEDSDEGNENARTDRLIRKLCKLASTTGVAVVVVAHPRKAPSSGKSPEQGARISLDDLKGSSSLKQAPDIVIALERNSMAETDEERSIATAVVLKNRYHGDTGVDVVKYDTLSCRYKAVSDQEVY